MITSVSLTSLNPTGIIDSRVNLTCDAVLSLGVSGSLIVFAYSNTDGSVATNFVTSLTSSVISIPVTLSLADEYTCTVTVTAPGVCGGGESEPDCPTMTSDAVTLAVKCKWKIPLFLVCLSVVDHN